MPCTLLRELIRQAFRRNDVADNRYYSLRDVTISSSLKCVLYRARSTGSVSSVAPLPERIRHLSHFALSRGETRGSRIYEDAYSYTCIAIGIIGALCLLNAIAGKVTRRYVEREREREREAGRRIRVTPKGPSLTMRKNCETQWRNVGRECLLRIPLIIQQLGWYRVCIFLREFSWPLFARNARFRRS